MTDTVTCSLCDLPAARPIEGDGGQLFCCSACVAVDRLVHSTTDDSNVPVGVQDETATETVSLSLAGMWCSSCSWLIDETLERAPGVASAHVSFLSREAQVEYDPDVTTPRALMASMTLPISLLNLYLSQTWLAVIKANGIGPRGKNLPTPLKAFIAMFLLTAGPAKGNTN